MKALKAFWRGCTDAVKGACGTILFIAAYVTVGVVIGVPYSLLASGKGTDVAGAVAFGPIVAFVILFFGFFGAEMKHGDGRPLHHWPTGIAFWILVGWISLPIAMNCVSIGFDRIGWHETSVWFYEWRYGSLIMGPVIAFMGLIAALSVTHRWKTWKSGIRNDSGPKPPDMSRRCGGSRRNNGPVQPRSAESDDSFFPFVQFPNLACN